MTTTDLTNRPTEITTDDGITVEVRWDAEWHRPDSRQVNVSHVEHGHCANLKGRPGHHDPFAEPTIGEQWAYTWHDRPTSIDGIAEADMPDAIALLVDVGRAIRTSATLRQQRADRTVEVLRAGRDAKADALTAGTPGPGRWQAYQDTGAQLDRVVIAALRDQLLDEGQIAEASGLSADQLRTLMSEVEYGRPATLYLGDDGFARRLGIEVTTLRSYKSRGRLPKPDIQLGGADGWSAETVEAYAVTRVGQGARTDLKP